jgi:hypothetical protein
MIGRLLQTAASTFNQTSSRTPVPLESITEESHTRDLLFPDPPTLRAGQLNASSYHSRAPATPREAASYDNRGGLEVTPGDIRIIIAQDSTPRHHLPQVLYDSKPSKVPIFRHGSLFDEHDATTARTLSARGKSVTTPVPLAGRHSRTPSTSIFNSAAQAPTSPTTPSERLSSVFSARPRPSPFEPQSPTEETTQSKIAREAREETDALLACMFGAAGFRDAGTKLHIIPKRSSEEAFAPKSPSSPRPQSSGQFARRRTPLVRSTSAADVNDDGPSSYFDSRNSSSGHSIMLTRLFAVNLPGSPTHVDESAEGYTNNLADSLRENNEGTPMKSNIKQKKVPMYAVAIILQLPSSGLQLRSRTSSHHGSSSLGSSYVGITPSSSWLQEKSIFASFMDVRNSGLLSSDPGLQYHVSQIPSQWAVIERSIDTIQKAAKTKLIVLLEREMPPDTSVPLLAAPPGRSNVAKLKRPKQPTQQSVHVTPECLQNDSEFEKLVDFVGLRIIHGVRTRRVITGQNRWGVWKDEARWFARWITGKEQNRFFYILLSAYLGTQTSWIRKSLKKSRHAEDMSKSITSRMVVVSSDKMVARRLIFLLGAFLPSSGAAAQMQGSYLSQSNTFSESPPISNRDQPLRRSINKGSSQKAPSEGNGHARSVSFSLVGTTQLQTEETIINRHTRRTSDARSVRSASLAIPVRPGNARKSSTSTILAEDAQPIPHFSNGPNDTPEASKRPDSTGRLASLALAHSLKISECSQGSSSGGRWGSVVSGFWSNRRDSSTDGSDTLASSHGSPKSPRKPTNRLERMVEEAAVLSDDAPLSQSPAKSLRIEDCLKKPHEGTPSQKVPHSTSKPERMPLKLSMNEEDGYIDISLRPGSHSFSSSLASSFTSTRFQEHHSSSPYGTPTSIDSPRPRSEPAIDAAGWLRTYHPDFTLQAVRPYEGLRIDIRASMTAEADSLSPEITRADGDWHDLCTTLIANTNKFTMTRIRLRRRQFPTASQHEEDFVTETLSDVDPTFAEALERVLGEGSSRVSSRAPSPMRSGTNSVGVHGNGGNRRDGQVLDGTVGGAETKRIVMGALDAVVGEVVRERGGKDGEGILREGIRNWLKARERVG